MYLLYSFIYQGKLFRKQSKPNKPKSTNKKKLLVNRAY